MQTTPAQPTHIHIRGANLHNLKNISVSLPIGKLIVITGLSGSGKSTLAFDTLYAEGQRRYVESLSAYARQFLGKFNKPQVESIENISPAIAIEQKVNTSNPRSTVGTSTEIYDYLKLLYARIGKTFSPISGKEVRKHSVSDVVDFITQFPIGERFLLLSKVEIPKGRTLQEQVKLLIEQGYVRIFDGSQVIRLEDVQAKALKKGFSLVIDRILVEESEEFTFRLADSVSAAFFEGKGTCEVLQISNNTLYSFSNRFEADGITFLEPNTHLFSFNNPYGACPTCDGYGNTIGISPDLVVPNTNLSVYDGAIYPWRGETMQFFKNELVNNAYKFNFPIHRPWYELTEDEKQLVWTGNKYFTGLNAFFKELESQNYKIQNRVLLARYRGKTICPDCQGKRLRAEANYVKIGGKAITELVDMPIDTLLSFISSLELSSYEKKVSNRLLKEIKNRLQYLCDVGLNYLTLGRKSNTLSGGESQRINLATSLGSSLVGSLYILDEPSIGLHPKDSQKLIQVLYALRDLGNTVIVVEHDPDIMKAADYIVDIGPYAGSEGGKIVAEGSYKQILKANSLTGQYLSGKKAIPLKESFRTSPFFITIKGARANNLKNIDVTFPLQMLTVVSGVSGSGKSTLVKQILYPALLKHFNNTHEEVGEHTSLGGNFEFLKRLEYIDQNPIGKSSRSNPVSYIKAYDDIRNLFANQKISKLRGYTAGFFSFNTDGGRCEVCKGEGETLVEMQFMADVHIPCEACEGKRFKKEVLEVEVGGKNIFDILNTTVDEAINFFKENKQDKIAQKLLPLQEVGLGYVQLGQSSSSLSGGEAQRVKLASFLMKSQSETPTLFIFDEPTTGLHLHDIHKLIDAFNALIERGHSLIVIEHNMEVIRSADYLIDLGKDGGIAGGNLISSGTPLEVAQNSESYTAKYLRYVLNIN